MLGEKFRLFLETLPPSAGSVYRRKVIDQTLERTGMEWSDVAMYLDNKELVSKPKRGSYDLGKAFDLVDEETSPVPVAQTETAETAGVKVSRNLDIYVPMPKDEYVPWGNSSKVERIIASGQFAPTYVAGVSGNGKTMMIEQACARLSREFVRVQVNPNTDEDDLIGGWRLINGETVFAEGPVIAAMRAGAILLIDEIDRSTNKIMCLQGILEGTPFLIKKTGEIVKPARGFNIIATGNTYGRGSDSGKYIAASVIDDAFLERFAITLDQEFPQTSVETKIVGNHMKKFGVENDEFVDALIDWSRQIRDIAEDESDDVISTRRLCHIVQNYSIFEDDIYAVVSGTNRFEREVRDSFISLFKSVKKDVESRQAQEAEEKKIRDRQQRLDDDASAAERKVLGNVDL